MTTKPRIPGSQVAPGQRPFSSSAPTASTHSKVPLAEATQGRTYRVRDKDWAAVWGENLSYDDAVKLRERVVTSRKSTTARVEDEAIPPPDWYVDPNGCSVPSDPETFSNDSNEGTETSTAGDGGGSLSDAETDATSPAVQGLSARTQYSLDDGGVEIVVKSPGVVAKVLAGHELVVNDQVRPLPTQVIAGDRVMARAVDPQIIEARARALAAARATRAVPKPKIAYRDKTVRVPVPRTGPAPKDKTVGGQVHVRLVAAPAPAAPRKRDILPSPLKVAMVPDGAPLPDDVPGEDDLHDLAVDLGGGPSDADLEHAARQRDTEQAG